MLDQTPQVLTRRFYGNARKWDFTRSTIVSRRKRETERSRCHFGILVEHLVEVSHPEEQNRVLVTRFDLSVLLHQWC
jgi:hypothetical protein